MNKLNKPTYIDYTFCVDFNSKNQKTKKPHETGFPKLGFIEFFEYN